MNNKKFVKQMLPAAVALALSTQAGAGIKIYDEGDTSFSVDGSFNTFYVQSDVNDKTAANADRDQSRVKMGFLPNWIGFDFAKKSGDLQLGGRSSFWVTINDSDPVRSDPISSSDASVATDATHGVTDTGIDVRQFYGTVKGDWGEILVGKDFALFNRTNILSDELLLGYGQTVTTGADGANVSFGNIATGYLYPMPVSQITYRSPNTSGFQLAVGLMDPNKASASNEEDTPRIEAELTYSTKFDGGSVKAWVGGMSQSSENVTTSAKVDSNGVSYGVNAKFGGLSLTASGFDADGVGAAGLGNLLTADDASVDGYLTQASYSFGSERVVASYGKNDGGSTAGASDLDLENTAVAWFHSVNSNLTLVAEYDQTESTSTDIDTVALGAVLSF